MNITRRERICLAIYALNLMVQPGMAVAHFSHGSALAWPFVVSSTLFLAATILMIRQIWLRSSLAH